jgi:hypothetical protein
LRFGEEAGDDKVPNIEPRYSLTVGFDVACTVSHQDAAVRGGKLAGCNAVVMDVERVGPNANANFKWARPPGVALALECVYID